MLDYGNNSAHLSLLKSIFVRREYACGFPFYENACVVDVGAHRGFFALFAALNTGADARIFSYEPSSDNYAALCSNVKDAGFAKKITAHHAAIAGKSGELTLHLGADINHSLYSDYALNEQNAGKETVKAFSLADIMEKHTGGRIDFLKLDCEGAEYEIVFSSPADIWQQIGTIAMEFHDMKNENQTGNRLIDFLIRQGYTILDFHYDPTNKGLNYGKIVASRFSS